MTLDKTWTECLRMWKWIARNRWRYGSTNEAKLRWLKLNGYGDKDICDTCFFCDYNLKAEDRATGLIDDDCHFCPGRKVDKNFRCNASLHHYMYNPKAFYAKLLELNKIRTSH